MHDLSLFQHPGNKLKPFPALTVLPVFIVYHRQPYAANVFRKSKEKKNQRTCLFLTQATMIIMQKVFVKLVNSHSHRLGPLLPGGCQCALRHCIRKLVSRKKLAVCECPHCVQRLCSGDMSVHIPVWRIVGDGIRRCKPACIQEVIFRWGGRRLVCGVLSRQSNCTAQKRFNIFLPKQNGYAGSATHHS